MTEMIRLRAARYARAVCILSAAFAVTLAPTSTINAQTVMPTVPTQTVAPTPQPQAAKPRWSELSPEQKQALAPLEGEWDNLDAFRKNKWLVIGNKFASMKPDEQQRVQERMRDWVRLTPDQRRMARENYVRTKKLKPDEKSAQWEQYQQLPEEERKKLAAEAASRKHVATLPPPAQRKDNKTVPPIKSAPKPVLEQSVTPQAASQSALQPTTPPANK